MLLEPDGSVYLSGTVIGKALPGQADVRVAPYIPIAGVSSSRNYLLEEKKRPVFPTFSRSYRITLAWLTIAMGESS